MIPQRATPGSITSAPTRCHPFRRAHAATRSGRLHGRMHWPGCSGRPFAVAFWMNNRAAAAIDAATWTLIGPRPTDGGTNRATAGRVNAIAIDPRNNDVVYIGAAE